MKKVIFEGSGVAIVTPFTDSGVDFDKLAELCEFHINSGTDAIIVAGTTGEASTMPDEEHLEVIKFVVDKVNKRLPVIGGTGSNDTAHAAELSFKAQECGADALLCVTPYYNKASQEGLYLHFKTVAQAVDIPIIMYNVPSRTAVNINPETVKRLCELDNIVAIKECNSGQVAKIAHLCKDEITIYTGEDGQILPVLSLGGKGAISVMANIVPDIVHKIVKSYLDGDTNTARQLQLEYVPLIDALFSDVNPIPVKEALNILGYNVGSCRMPLCDMSEEKKNGLRKVLSGYDIRKGGE